MIVGKTFINRSDFLKALNQKITPILIKILSKELGVHNNEAEICLDKYGKPEANNDLKDTERVPLVQDIYEYFEKEVKPYAPDAWIDESIKDDKDGKIGKIGYEIPFTRYFYSFLSPRLPDEIQSDIDKLEEEIKALNVEI
jgi:type I restriction enzyme M protein